MLIEQWWSRARAAGAYEGYRPTGAAALALLLGSVGSPAVGQQFVPGPSIQALQVLGGQNAAQRDMARSIDGVCPTLFVNRRVLKGDQNDLLRICTRMIDTALDGPTSYGIGDDELNGVIQAINGEELQAPQVRMTEAKDTQVANLGARLAGLRSGAMGGMLSTAGLSLDTGREVLVASEDDGFLPEGLRGGIAGDGRLGIFLTGGVGLGDRDRTGELDSFDFATTGLTAGVDYRLTEELILGVALGYSVFDADFDGTPRSPSGQKLDSDSYTLSLYGTYYPTASLYLDAIASVGYSDYDGKRRIVIESQTGQPSERRTARADFDALLYGASLKAGYELPLGGFSVTPTIGVDYQHGDIDDFEENGARGLDLAFDGQDADSLTGSVGLQASYSWSLPFGVLVPSLRATWVHEFTDDDDGARVQFANDPTGVSAFELTTVSKDSDYGVVGGGLALALPYGFGLFADYDTAVGLDDLTVHRVSAGVRKTF